MTSKIVTKRRQKFVTMNIIQLFKIKFIALKYQLFH